MPDDGLIRLADRKLEEVHEVVDLLEKTLARARLGKVRGVAIAVGDGCGEVATAYEHGDVTRSDLYYAIGILRRRLEDHD